MEFILENIDINNYRGEIIFYWLERNITFTYKVDKIKQDNKRCKLKLDCKLPGTYRLGHNLQNKNTNMYEDIEINIMSDGVIELKGGIKKRLEWVYLKILNIEKDDIIIENYDKELFRKEENDVKRRTEMMNIEYWNNYWKCLHLISIIYPKDPDMDIKMSIKRLLKKLSGDGLTCNNCRRHFIKYLSDKNREKIGSNKEELINFFLGLHNNINKRNNKKEWSKKEVKEFYKDSERISNELILNLDINIISLLKTREIDKFPDIYNKIGRERLKRKWGLFILEK
jgi:hypothetical protein